MIKVVITVWRRPEFTREAFVERWRGDHAALVTRHAEVLRMRRYVQSHRIASREIDDFSDGRGWAPAADGVTEIWWDNAEDVAAGFGSAEGRAASLELKRDEEVFVEMSKVTAFMSTEHVVFGRGLLADA